jgi:hypothetical protein
MESQITANPCGSEILQLNLAGLLPHEGLPLAEMADLQNIGESGILQLNLAGLLPHEGLPLAEMADWQNTDGSNSLTQINTELYSC